MENLGMNLFGNCFKDRRVLLTGHTGFKGSWLALWLVGLGATVSGISLNPESQPNHLSLLDLNIDDYRLDIRDAESVTKAIEKIQPEIVFHLAAQSLVRFSYSDPIGNWSTNVMGTANILDGCRRVGCVKGIVAITTDKVYNNKEWLWGYRENDELGGHDPYSASKAACEILIDSYRKSFFSQGVGAFIASARAGNVIGGGDWAEDRLIPDLVRSVEDNVPLIIRSPEATRPWQHVLDCLAGYLLLGQKFLENKSDFAEAWNFGPKSEDNRTVSEVLDLMHSHWPQLQWEKTLKIQPHEANLLYLDSTKAQSKLNWKPVWELEKALRITVDWYRDYYLKNIVSSEQQLLDYIKDAADTGVSWVTK